MNMLKSTVFVKISLLCHYWLEKNTLLMKNHFSWKNLLEWINILLAIIIIKVVWG